jgi:predicted amidophosphoribosyltransferase
MTAPATRPCSGWGVPVSTPDGRCWDCFHRYYQDATGTSLIPVCAGCGRPVDAGVDRCGACGDRDESYWAWIGDEAPVEVEG